MQDLDTMKLELEAALAEKTRVAVDDFKQKYQSLVIETGYQLSPTVTMSVNGTSLAMDIIPIKVQ